MAWRTILFGIISLIGVTSGAIYWVHRRTSKSELIHKEKDDNPVVVNETEKGGGALIGREVACEQHFHDPNLLICWFKPKNFKYEKSGLGENKVPDIASYNHAIVLNSKHRIVKANEGFWKPVIFYTSEDSEQITKEMYELIRDKLRTTESIMKSKNQQVDELEDELRESKEEYEKRLLKRMKAYKGIFEGKDEQQQQFGQPNQRNTQTYQAPNKYP